MICSGTRRKNPSVSVEQGFSSITQSKPNIEEASFPLSRELCTIHVSWTQELCVEVEIVK